MPSKSSRRCEINPITIVVNASWLYPFKGFVYFLSNRRYWPLFKARLLTISILSIFIYATLFTFAFIPQALFLLIFHGPGAWVNATFLTLGEGSVIVALLFEAFFVDETQVDIFDAVLIDQGCQDLLTDARQLDENAENSVKMLGKPIISSVYSPFSFRQIVELIILLPLNLIPFVGVPLFLLLTGYRAGPFHHWRYFKLRGFDKKERKKYIKQRQLKYTWFGTVALTLQLIPVLSMLFLVTSAAGSALWAAKMERERRLRLADSDVPQESDEGALA